MRVDQMAEQNDDKRMELTAHLQELRARIMRSLMYLVVGAVVAYFFFTPIYGFLTRPLKTTMDRVNRERIARQLAESTRPGASGDQVYVLPVPLKPGEVVTAETFN